MVAIKDFEMPSCCGLCERYLRTCEYRFENAQTKRHPDCPLVEIEERNRGKWEHDKLFGECAYVCSFCHTIWTSSEIQNMHYCPTCGAIMRGAENG